MDNIFEILIYLFIIISFLSSFFRKKKKAAAQQEQAQIQITDQQRLSGELEVEEAPPVQTQRQDYDILKEFEDFFKVGERKGESQIQTQNDFVEEPDVYKKEDQGVLADSFHTRTASEHNFIDA
jgi:hypothetical protein